MRPGGLRLDFDRLLAALLSLGRFSCVGGLERRDGAFENRIRASRLLSVLDHASAFFESLGSQAGEDFSGRAIPKWMLLRLIWGNALGHVGGFIDLELIW